MAVTILDRVNEDYEGLNEPEYLLRGLSRAGQDKLIQDQAKRFARKAKGSGIGRFNAESYAKSISNLPENVQDAIVYAGEKAPIRFIGGIDGMTTASQYDMGTNKVGVSDGFANNLNESLLHELSHWVDHNHKRKRVPVRNLMDNDVSLMHESKAAKDNFGKLLNDELLKANIVRGKEIEPFYIGNVLAAPGMLGQDIAEALTDDMGDDAKQYAENVLPDMVSLRNDSRPLEYGSHGAAYKRKLQNAYALSGETNEDVLANVPLSIEGVAEYVPFMGFDGGAERLRDVTPKSYGYVDNAFGMFPLKNNYVPRNEKYANAEGLRLIAERNARLEQNRQKALDRYNAKFMLLPQDKQNYYNNANEGDVLWLRDPSFKSDDPEDGVYWAIKGRDKFRGDRLRIENGRNANGQFHNNSFGTIDLNQLEPTFVPKSDFLKDYPFYESDEFKKKRGLK